MSLPPVTNKEVKKIKKKSPSGVTKKKKEQKKRHLRVKKEKRGVVYLSHIPHGFYEDQIKAYFSQFGEVTGVNLPRSKMGRARGYAFIEFRHPDVAKIAAETMDNYLMHNRLLKAKYIAPKDQKPFIFVHIQGEDFKTLKEQSLENIKRNRHLKNASLNKKEVTKKIKKMKVKHSKTQEKLSSLGISYDYDVISQ